MLVCVTDPNGEDLLVNPANVLFVETSGHEHCEIVFWVHEKDAPISRRVRGTLDGIERRLRGE